MTEAMATRLLSDARAALRRGDLEAAAGRLAEARAAAPGHPLLSTTRVQIARAAGRPADARAAVAEALAAWDGVIDDAPPARPPASVTVARLADHARRLHLLTHRVLVAPVDGGPVAAQPGFYGVADGFCLPHAGWAPLTRTGHLLLHDVVYSPALLARTVAGAGRWDVERHGSAPLVVPGGSPNWYHFLLDHLPKVLAALDAGLPEAGWRLAATPDEHGWLAEILGLLGVGGEQVTWLSPDRAHDLPRALYVSNFGVHGNIHPLAVALLRGFAAGLERRGQLPGPGARRIFVSRRDAAFRRLAGEADLHPELERRGFAIVDPGGRTVLDQIRMFRNAEIVAGVHGAGLANMVWARTGPAVVELAPHTRDDGFYAMLARACGGPHAVVRAAADETDVPFHYRSDFALAPARVLAAIDRAIG